MNTIEQYELTDEEVTLILQAYRNEQLKRNLIGPGISGIMHIIL